MNLRTAKPGKGLSLFAGVTFLYLLLGLAYSLLVPIWEAPDEPLHYRYALLLARENRQPSNQENSESYQPPTYYFFASLPLRLIDAVDPDLVQFYIPGVVEDEIYRYIDWDESNYRWIWGAVVLRWANLALGVASLALIFLGVRMAFPQTPSLWAGVLLLIGLTPQFIHNTSSVSNDPLAILAGALLFWITIRLLKGDFRPAILILIGLAALALPLVTKLTVLPAGIVTAGVAFWKFQGRRTEVKINRTIAAGALFLIAVILLALLLFPTAFQNLWLDIEWRLTYLRPNILERPVWKTLYVYAWSFWGRLGWRDVGLPIPIIVLLSGLSLGGLWLALSRFPWRGKRAIDKFPARPIWVYLWACLAVAGLVLLRNYFNSVQAQGRFLFPVFAPLAVLVVGGWHAGIRPTNRKWIPWVIAVIMFALNLYVLLEQVIPLYFQPFLDGV
jgi:hypothetical protein